MKNLEKYRIFAPELRCSLHIAKYRNVAEVRSFPYCYLYYVGKRPTS